MQSLIVCYLKPGAGDQSVEKSEHGDDCAGDYGEGEQNETVKMSKHRIHGS